MSNKIVEQVVVRTDITALIENRVAKDTAFFNQDGTPFNFSSGGGSTGITEAEAVAAVAAKPELVAVSASSVADAAVSADAPTKAEFDAVVALANDLKAKLNALLTALKA